MFQELCDHLLRNNLLFERSVMLPAQAKIAEKRDTAYRMIHVRVHAHRQHVPGRFHCPFPDA